MDNIGESMDNLGNMETLSVQFPTVSLKAELDWCAYITDNLTFVSIKGLIIWNDWITVDINLICVVERQLSNRLTQSCEVDCLFHVDNKEGRYCL